MRKLDRVAPSQASRAYAQPARADRITAPRPALGLDRPVAHVLGIPDSEVTPAVQAAMDMLLGEVGHLRHEIATLRERLAHAETLADIDPLVPLRNRRSFVRELERMIAYAERHGHDIALLMVDVDDLKPINDHAGHAAGDEVIRQVAAALVDSTRSSDLLGRLGGDEFGVVLMDMDRIGAQITADRICAAVGERSVPMPGGGERALSVSCGVCAFEPGLSLQEALDRADAAMYRHKQRHGDAARAF